MSIQPAFNGGDGYHTDFYGVYRWSEHMGCLPGRYVVVATKPVLYLAWMGDKMTYRHPVCVVDDFGQLVAVPQ